MSGETRRKSASNELSPSKRLTFQSPLSVRRFRDGDHVRTKFENVGNGELSGRDASFGGEDVESGEEFEVRRSWLRERDREGEV